ncbi:MAG: hypothetical protein GY820_18555 [Gammaproteobacteria bacterium]|nr:hypothetical protein [Gammaproteobacteria bacterium]
MRIQVFIWNRRSTHQMLQCGVQLECRRLEFSENQPGDEKCVEVGGGRIEQLL